MKKKDLFYAVFGTLIILLLSWMLFASVEVEEGDQPYYNILAGAMVFALATFTAMGWNLVFRSREEEKNKYV